MVNGQRGGSRVGIVVVSLLGLGAVEACGSRSPLSETFEDGVGETGGTGGGAGGSTGGTVTSGGVGGTGVGGAYPSTGGAYPGAGGAYGGTGGVYPGTGGAYGGTGGVVPGVGGAYPGVGGAYPSAGYGGTGMAVGGAFVTGGTGGKGMGAGGKGMGSGGKGGGKGDPAVYKGCLLVCGDWNAQCPDVAQGCLDECTAVPALFPGCSRPFADWLYCLSDYLSPVAMCSQDTCDGPSGCMEEAQELCEGAKEDVMRCLDPEPRCDVSGEFYEGGCRLQTTCGATKYDTTCYALDASMTTFECSCATDSSAGVTVISGLPNTEVCYEMHRQCGFPQVLPPF